MAAVPVIGRRRVAAPVRVRPGHRDHRFEDRPVLAAVEVLNALAGSVRVWHPEVDWRHMGEARFQRFAFLPPAPAVLDAFHELEPLGDGRVRAALMTRRQGQRSAISRTAQHAAVVFGGPARPPGRRRDAAAPDGFTVSADRLYRDLVPFGPAFRSIVGELVLSPKGAVARVRDRGELHVSGPIEAPLVLDGAFHAACAWGQRYAGVVAFPVGFARREIITPVVAGTLCRAEVFVGGAADGVLTFDIRLSDENDTLCETVEGLDMRDLSRGRLQPPAWVRH